MKEKTKTSPTIDKLKGFMWKLWYQHLAKTYKIEEWKFLNYGYAPLNGNPEMLDLAEDDIDSRYGIQLYYHVAGAVDLTDLEVLEVGSGRGAGSDFIKRYLKPKKMIGVDFAKDAVEIAKERYNMDGLSFEVGNAVSLPFDDESFDAVVNVESSHCYPSMVDFLGQVKRILRKGGHFLFADLRPSNQLNLMKRQLIESGLTILNEKEITPNVIEALKLDNERKMVLIKNNIKKSAMKSFMKFAGTEDSPVNQKMKNGEVVYMSYVMQKP